jgi:hypothetical protein
MFDSIVALLKKVEGRDKLTKLIIYLLKLADALGSLLRRYPTYRYEKIASTRKFTQSTFKEQDSSCGLENS